MPRNIIMTAMLMALAAAGWGGPAGAQGAIEDATLEWMSGHWEVTQAGHLTEEVWSAPAGGLLLGYGRTLRDGEVTGFEFLRLTTGEGAALFAQPGGQPPTRFALTQVGDQMAVFENPDHDFPQRLAYRREGEMLHVVVSDMSGTSSLTWAYQLTE